MVKRSIGKDGETYYSLTKQDVDNCFALIKGEAQPSDFGYDFTWAALLIAFFIMMLEKFLEDCSPELKEYHKDMIKRGKEVCRMYGEAGKLSGEQED